MKRQILIFVAAFMVIAFLLTFTSPLLDLHSDTQGDFNDDYGWPAHWIRVHVHADYRFDGVYSHRNATTRASIVSLPACLLTLFLSASAAGGITWLYTRRHTSTAHNREPKVA